MAAKFALTFLVLVLAWIVFTGSLAAYELYAGLFASFIITILVYERFIKGHPKHKLHPLRWFYFIVFVVNLAGREIKAHLNLIRIILSPKLNINPNIIEVQTDFKSDAGITILGNSVTLTPGTLTVDAEPNKLLVHWIDQTETTPHLLKIKIFGKSESILGGVAE
jgi:multicomponent Na+:H+ antiporter subunit E